MRTLTLGVCVCLLIAACSSKPDDASSNIAAAQAAKKENAELRRTIKLIEPFFQRMGKPSAYDWLGSHKEPGQTFEEYIDSDPVKPTKERQKIYILPLGKFTPEQQKVIEIASGYLGVFYDLPIAKLPARMLPVLQKAGDSRMTSSAGQRGLGKQFRTGFIMDTVLKPILADDAAALIAFTNEDLYPDASMNYVFGQASMEDRVGVWSLFRLQQNASYDTFLRRTIKIATHETGHMFSMHHCTKYECVMSGTNYLGETDRRPIDACPECTAKVCWLSHAVPSERYEKLAAYCRANGLAKESESFNRLAAAVRS